MEHKVSPLYVFKFMCSKSGKYLLTILFCYTLVCAVVLFTMESLQWNTQIAFILVEAKLEKVCQLRQSGHSVCRARYKLD